MTHLLLWDTFDWKSVSEIRVLSVLTHNPFQELLLSTHVTNDPLLVSFSRSFLCSWEFHCFCHYWSFGFFSFEVLSVVMMRWERKRKKVSRAKETFIWVRQRIHDLRLRLKTNHWKWYSLASVDFIFFSSYTDSRRQLSKQKAKSFSCMFCVHVVSFLWVLISLWLLFFAETNSWESLQDVKDEMSRVWGNKCILHFVDSVTGSTIERAQERGFFLPTSDKKKKAKRVWILKTCLLGIKWLDRNLLLHLLHHHWREIQETKNTWNIVCVEKKGNTIEGKESNCLLFTIILQLNGEDVHWLLHLLDHRKLFLIEKKKSHLVFALSSPPALPSCQVLPFDDSLFIQCFSFFVLTTLYRPLDQEVCSMRLSSLQEKPYILLLTSWWQVIPDQSMQCTVDDIISSKERCECDFWVTVHSIILEWPRLPAFH